MPKRDRPISGLKGQALKDFRSQVAKAKKKGLVSKRVDARSQKPTKYMRAKMRALAPVFEGTSIGVKVPPKMAREYKRAGFTVFNSRVITRAEPGEIAKVKKGMVAFRKPLGGDFFEERVILPISPTSIDELLLDVEKSGEKYDALKEPDELFAFKLFGFNSLATFEDFGLLAEYLSHYKVFETHDGPDTWEGINFYRVVRGKWQPTPKRPYKRRRGGDQDRRTPSRPVVPAAIKRSNAAEYKRQYRASHPTFRAAERDRDRLAQAKRRERERAARADKENGWN